MQACSTAIPNPFITDFSRVSKHSARRSTLTFVALKEISEHKEYARVSHIVGDVIFFEIIGYNFTEDDATAISQRIRKLIDEKKQITFATCNKVDYVYYLTQTHRTKKSNIVSSIEQDEILIAFLDDYVDYVLDPMIADLTDLGDFKIETDGHYLRLVVAPPLSKSVADAHCPENVNQLCITAKKRWEKRGVHNFFEANKFISSQPFASVREITDASSIASLDEIEKHLISQFPQRRVISIAGPSSSGKTTVSAPIKHRLEQHGLKCIVITTDDYFVNRRDMIPNAEGKLEFESINAVHSALLGERVRDLLEGKAVPKRHYDFLTGTGKDTDETVCVGPDGIIIVEGIHGVNPELLKHLGPAPQTIYVAPMTPMSIDDEHCLTMGDICLIRRIIRDNEERGYSARLNVAWWGDVREGEEVNICPFVENADILFDSSFIYELPLMRSVANEILYRAFNPEPNEQEIDSKFRTSEINRFIRIFSFVQPLALPRLPSNPVIQEFLDKAVSDIAVTLD